MARLRRPRRHDRAQWHDWRLAPGGGALYFMEPERGVEVPFRDLVTPHELWRTLVHFVIEKIPRQQLGYRCTRRQHAIDLAAFLLAVHDVFDLWRIYLTGMDVDAPDAYPNLLTRHLLGALEALPLEPSTGDLAALGGRILDGADLFDARAIFAGA
jgi:hypothetical protein